MSVALNIMNWKAASVGYFRITYTVERENVFEHTTIDSVAMNILEKREK